MVFSSTIFIFAFLPITLVLYYCAVKLNSIRVMNSVLLLASMFFYAWGGVIPFLMLLLIIFLNYILTVFMDTKSGNIRKLVFILILIIDIGNLFYFKYYNFFVDNAKALVLKISGVEIWQNVATVALPIGISFYTFQIISYVIDVYLDKVEVQKNPFDLALYVMMFPQLIAGPIVRYKDVNNEIANRNISIEDVEYGIKRFIIGFAKKVFLANSMGNMADIIFSQNGTSNMIYAWLGAICYTMQIYFDFSAYSDMAIGIGRILGFHFNENFKLPYISESIQEFWRRWHISLSSWFRDYVYIPLGGNRKGVKRTYINLSIVFLLTGIWHGAAWQFIVWGLYHGVFSVIERLGFNKVLKKIPLFFRRLYTMIVVIVGWVFFRADNISLALEYIKNMFSFNFSWFKNVDVVISFDSLFIITMIISIAISMMDMEKIKNIGILKNKNVKRLAYIGVWLISMLYLTGLSYNPFIYFKF